MPQGFDGVLQGFDGVLQEFDGVLQGFYGVPELLTLGVLSIFVVKKWGILH